MAILVPESAKHIPEPTYRHCDVAIPVMDAYAMDKIREHIHYHRLGTKETVATCVSCTIGALRQMTEILELYQTQ